MLGWDRSVLTILHTWAHQTTISLIAYLEILATAAKYYRRGLSWISHLE